MYTWSGVEEDPDEQERDWGDGDEPGRHAGDRDHHHHHHHRQRHHDDRHQHRHHNHNWKCADLLLKTCGGGVGRTSLIIKIRVINIILR